MGYGVVWPRVGHTHNPPSLGALEEEHRAAALRAPASVGGRRVHKRPARQRSALLPPDRREPGSAYRADRHLPFDM